MADKTVHDGKKPDTPYDHKVETPGGRRIDVHGDGRVAGAWLELPGRDHSLFVVSHLAGSDVLNYVGYRDGKRQYPKITVSADGDGGVTLQIVLGEGDRDIRRVSLERLEQWVRDDPNPEPA